jgi:hypothetical protein
MVDPWQILRDGGLPLALPRTDAKPTPRELADATRDAIAAKPRGREVDALTAFVLAWAHHWPTSFAAAFGDDTCSVSAWAESHTTDENRYLKLRRIALENLASVL